MENVNTRKLSLNNVPENNDVAYGVFRGHPVTFGHTDIVNQMISNHKKVIIGIGSAQRHNEAGYPFNVEQRIQQWKNIYGERISYVPIVDLGTCDPKEWSAYNMEKLTKIGLPEPTDYYGGLENASWYRFHFLMDGQERTEDHVNAKGVLRRLHICTRNIPISGTEVRAFIELGMDNWKRWVPAVNHDLIETCYPKHLLVSK